MMRPLFEKREPDYIVDSLHCRQVYATAWTECKQLDNLLDAHSNKRLHNEWPAANPEAYMLCEQFAVAYEAFMALVPHLDRLAKEKLDTKTILAAFYSLVIVSVKDLFDTLAESMLYSFKTIDIDLHVHQNGDPDWFRHTKLAESKGARYARDTMKQEWKKAEGRWLPNHPT